jgi:hypothetical protein
VVTWMPPQNRRPSPEAVAAKKAEIEKRYARKKGKGQKLGFAARILRQLQAVFADRYGLAAWPDDDDGASDDLEILVNYLVMNRKIAGRHVNPRHHLSLIAPWLSAKDVDRLIQSAERHPIYWTQAELGQRIGLTYEVRKRCKAWNIDPIDCTLAECRRRSREESDQKRRRPPPPTSPKTRPLASKEQVALAALGDGEVAMAELVRRVAKERCFKKLTEPRREVHKIVDRLKARGLVCDRCEPSDRAPVRIVWKAQKL